MGQAVEAVRRLDEIQRGTCRSAYERRFSARRMAERYVEVYAALDAARYQQGDDSAVKSSSIP
jgi:hypothetical protein